ncbi:MAG: radical SAM protein [Candidatus Omnitrophota bacterium]|jgi:radical SAM protein with 4Fe4S-binding SPASM domain
MLNRSPLFFYDKINAQPGVLTPDALLELTYRCNLRCIHCYAKDSGNKRRELTASVWKDILDQLARMGCLWVTFTGGEPLIRDDFLEIYAYAREKGFLVVLFTNATLFTERVIKYLARNPPQAIEVTLNGSDSKTYEGISATRGSFVKCAGNIIRLAEAGLTLSIKANLMKQNKNELWRIKEWADSVLKKTQGEYLFKYDPLIYPRINGDKSPCGYRLNFGQITSALRRHKDLWNNFCQDLRKDIPDPPEKIDSLYYCACSKFKPTISPDGKLKFCVFSEDFSVDLKEYPLKEAVNMLYSRIRRERFNRPSACSRCSLRTICGWCPVRARLETGSPYRKVGYYCRIARRIAEMTIQQRKAGSKA